MISYQFRRAGETVCSWKEKWGGKNGTFEIVIGQGDEIYYLLILATISAEKGIAFYFSPLRNNSLEMGKFWVSFLLLNGKLLQFCSILKTNNRIHSICKYVILLADSQKQASSNVWSGIYFRLWDFSLKEVADNFQYRLLKHMTRLLKGMHLLCL